MDEISTEVGFTLHRDHKYELITRYNNTTQGDIDAMSILYIYCRDWTFENQTSASGALGSNIR